MTCLERSDPAGICAPKSVFLLLAESSAEDGLTQLSLPNLGNIDLDTTIDLLYAPMYYRLQMGTGPLSGAYVDGIVDHAIEGLLQRRD